jgi:energy-coupling factor transport system ATP-binding protein
MIRFDRVTFRYNEKSETSFALKEVSFSCSKNAVNGIIGANGCGKSTVLKLAAGLIRQESGIIEVDGCVDSFRNQQKKLITGIIFQNPDNQIVGTTVEEDLAFGLENLGVAPETMRERIASVADTFKMTDLLQTPVNWLSGGQKQLLCIASVVIMEPSWILFDEPTTHLDPWAREDFWHTVAFLVHEKGLGVMIVSQMIEDLTRFDNIYAFTNGTLDFAGTSSEYRIRATQKNLLLPESWKFDQLMRMNNAQPVT